MLHSNNPVICKTFLDSDENFVLFNTQQMPYYYNSTSCYLSNVLRGNLYQKLNIG